MRRNALALVVAAASIGWITIPATATSRSHDRLVAGVPFAVRGPLAPVPPPAGLPVLGGAKAARASHVSTLAGPWMDSLASAFGLLALMSMLTWAYRRLSRADVTGFYRRRDGPGFTSR